MRVLLLGAAGFLGSAILAHLTSHGLQVRALTRRANPQPRDAVEWVEGDLRNMLDPKAWRPLVEGCDAVINCAGVFASSPRDAASVVHVTAPAALYRACEDASVRRVILISAIGVDDRLTPFAKTKKDGEALLTSAGSRLKWVILRPSIVLGAGASGGSALLRGLAALPILPVERAQGEIQPVQIEDLLETILFFTRPAAQTRLMVDIVGPERYTLTETVAHFRAWLGWSRATVLTLPRWIMAPLYAGGELANLLGWRSPVNFTGRREMQRGATGQVNGMASVITCPPRKLEAALADRPAGHQERLAASLYFLTPFVILITALFWIGTGIVSVGPGYGIGVRLLEIGGVGSLSGPSVIAGGLADMCIGLGMLWRPTTRLALYGAIAISLFYFVAGTVLLPQLWADPIGPMLKIWPLIAFNIVALVMIGKR